MLSCVDSYYVKGALCFCTVDDAWSMQKGLGLVVEYLADWCIVSGLRRHFVRECSRVRHVHIHMAQVSLTRNSVTPSPFRPLKTMANRKACSALIVAVVVFTGLRHAFVPAPARGAAPMAAAGGMLSMLGAQAAHADKIDDAAKPSCRRRPTPS